MAVTQIGPTRGNFGLRVASALVLAPLALAAVWFGGPGWAALLLAGTAALGVEWTQLCGRGQIGGARGLLTPATLLIATALALAGMPAFALLTLAIGAALAAVLLRSAAGVCGIPYLGLGAIALAWLRLSGTVGAADLGRNNLLFVMLVVWATDIGAYAVGRTIGGPKLAPAISPGKTWSGACGGLVAAMIVAPGTLLLLGAPWTGAEAVVAALLSVMAQAGDLLESGIKRRFGVKDSGWMIPGHGGLLDRVDGLIAAAPLAALLALSFGRGVLL